MYFDHADYVRNSPEYREMIKALETETEHFLKYYKDDSRFISGWGHGYFCEEDGGRLTYDIQEPLEHHCSICHRVYRDYRYNACFVTMMRNEAVVTCIKSGILYQVTGEEIHVSRIKDIIGFYRDHYQEFPVHAKDKIWCTPTEDVGGAGKIMPQGLNEAIIGIRMINALELVKDALDPEWLRMTKEELFAPMVELLRPQKKHIHNIPVWINSAIGVIGFFFGEKNWIEEATEQPFHLFEQLEKGVTESGFWYEGSIHYNFFALEGVMNFFTFAKAYCYAVPRKYEDIVFHMLDAAYQYAFDNDIFPNPSDGWPNIGLKTYSYIYDMAYKALGTAILPYIKAIEANPAVRVRLPLSEPYYYDNRISLERLLFTPQLQAAQTSTMKPRNSSNFEAYNCATLRNPWFNLFFKYGHQTRSHAHPDKMSLELMVKGKVLSKDLSNSGYVSRLCNEWHRTIAAHNTCAVNGKPSDMEQEGTCLSYTPESVRATVHPYPGVVYTRELLLKGDCLKDRFCVETQEDFVIDWFFHVDGSFDKVPPGSSSEVLFEEYGRNLFFDVTRLPASDGRVVLNHSLAALTLSLEPGMEVYLAKTYDNPADRMRDTIIIRTRAKKAVFQMEMKAE